MIEFGYAAGQQHEVCAHVEGADRMLCGRKLGRIMVSIETAPGSLHGRCRELLDPVPPAALLGVCSVCGENAPVEGGLIGPHGGCLGVNLPAGRRQS